MMMTMMTHLLKSADDRQNYERIYFWRLI